MPKTSKPARPAMKPPSCGPPTRAGRRQPAPGTSTRSPASIARAQAARPHLDAVGSQNRYLGVLSKAVEDADHLVTQRELERDQAAATLSGTRNPFGCGRCRAGLQ